MCTIKEHMATMNSEAYCPSCGESKRVNDDYCPDCEQQSEKIDITAITNYTVGYLSDITSFCP